MYKHFKDVKNISYPVFKLKENIWYEQDGVLFSGEGKVLDDTNMPGATLGVRRLQCGRKDLLRLRRAYPDFASMLQSKATCFIDSKGEPFIYCKTMNSPLVYHKVSKIELKDTCTVIKLAKIPYSFKLPRPPYGDAAWARVLYYRGAPWILYDFASSRGRDSYKRV
jgi:hypothetical protein